MCFMFRMVSIPPLGAVRVFEAAARLGNFTRAAEELGTTQAAVSQRIATLEEELGVRLLERSDRPIRLTAAGERVLPVAERMLTLERELLARARPDAPPAGRVRIGVIESVVHTWLTPLIRELAQRYPDVHPDLTVDTARNLREQFRHHRLDLVIQNDPIEEAAGNEELTVEPLCRYPVRWVGSPGLLPRKRLSKDDLLRVPLLTFSRTSSPHAHVRALFEGSEIEPRINSFPSVAAILRLVTEGFGLAAVPPLFVRAELERGDLVEYAGPTLPALEMSVAHMRATPPAVQAVAETTRSVVSGYCQQVDKPWAISLLEGETLEP